ncbi:hypothetical protein [Longispora urticae]
MAKRGKAGLFEPIAKWLRGGRGGPRRPHGVPGPHDTPRYPHPQHMQPQYKYESAPGHPKAYFKGKVVRRLSPEELEQHRVFFDKQGVLRSARDGQPFDTRNGTSVWASGGDRRAIFVMDSRGNMYASNYQEVGAFHHSTLANGGPVAAAGELSVTNGQVNFATAASGHYRPEPHHMGQLAQEFTRNGVRPPIYDFQGPGHGRSPMFR